MKLGLCTLNKLSTAARLYSASAVKTTQTEAYTSATENSPSFASDLPAFTRHLRREAEKLKDSFTNRKIRQSDRFNKNFPPTKLFREDLSKIENFQRLVNLSPNSRLSQLREWYSYRVKQSPHAAENNFNLLLQKAYSVGNWIEARAILDEMKSLGISRNARTWGLSALASARSGNWIDAQNSLAAFRNAPAASSYQFEADIWSNLIRICGTVKPVIELSERKEGYMAAIEPSESQSFDPKAWASTLLTPDMLPFSTSTVQDITWLLIRSGNFDRAHSLILHYLSEIENQMDPAIHYCK